MLQGSLLLHEIKEAKKLCKFSRGDGSFFKCGEILQSLSITTVIYLFKLFSIKKVPILLFLEKIIDFHSGINYPLLGTVHLILGYLYFCEN